jgi:dTDP-4-dehydrorhamnose 3,5-epimerase
MIFTPTELDGVWLIDIQRRDDDRGFFARTWCRQELAALGLETEVVQESISYSRRCGTLRGLHFQRTPHEETKIVRCTCGMIFDVLVDLRPQSATFLRWQSFKLVAECHQAIYIPKGVAHGFQTLSDNAEVSYQMSTYYTPEAAGGYRYDDPAFGITWPLPVTIISERDLCWPAYSQ